MRPIVFGTSGWRGPVGQEVTPARMEALARAVARWVWKGARDPAQPRKVIVGRDARPHSEGFEKVLVRTLLSHEGIDVIRGKGESPTPAVAWALCNPPAADPSRADLGLVVTASHNPPTDNGLKLLLPDGRLAPNDVTSEILAHLDTAPPRPPHAHPAPREADLTGAYVAGLRALVPPPPRRARIVADAMHGAGRRAICEAFDGWGPLHAIHTDLDPAFGGRRPDPRPETLEELARLTREEGADIGCALDGDGDRFGIVDALGRFVPPHELIPLLVEELLLRGPRGPVARSVCTSHVIDAVARAHRVPVIETAVGFKHLGRAMVEEGAVMACEESGGFAWLPHLPGKDGLLACLLAADMVCRRGAPLHELLGEFHRRFPPRPFARMDRIVPDRDGLFAAIEEDPPREVSGRRVVHVGRVDGLKFHLSDGSWLLVRKAGTEPVLRWYAEAADAGALPRLLAEAEEIEWARRSGSEEAAEPARSQVR